jgi:hypothetical protein
MLRVKYHLFIYLFLIIHTIKVHLKGNPSYEKNKIVDIYNMLDLKGMIIL